MIDTARPTLCALGSVNLDFMARAGRLPEPGETMLVRDFRRLGGGKAANRAVVARRLGAPASLIARVGDDDFADEALRFVGELGVDLDGVRRVTGAPTGVAMIVVGDDGDKTIALAANANGDWQAADIDAAVAIIDALAPGSVLTVDLEVPIDVVVAAARAARAWSSIPRRPSG